MQKAFQEFVAIRPRAISGFLIDMPGCPQVNEFAPPAFREELGALERDCRIVVAGNNNRPKWQNVQRHWRKALRATGIRSGFGVAWSDKQRAVDPPLVARPPM